MSEVTEPATEAPEPAEPDEASLPDKPPVPDVEEDTTVPDAEPVPDEEFLTPEQAEEDPEVDNTESDLE